MTNMAIKRIHASVGMHKNGTRNCFNLSTDVQTIVGLLNLVSSSEGAPDDPLPASPSPPELYRAIINFQQKQNDLGRVPRLSVDGHVDPGAPTLERLNRLADHAPAPYLPVLPDPVPNLGPDYSADPNTVFAGDRFRIKVLEGVSFGEVFGYATYTFAIWDLENSRGAAYEYKIAILTVGTPITDSGEGDWSDPFKTPKALQVDQFGGLAEHTTAGGGPLGIFWLTFIKNPYIGSAKFIVKVPTGNSKGFGGEFGGKIAASGSFDLVAGSVKPFSDPDVQ
jgi:hypothetical protein